MKSKRAFIIAEAGVNHNGKIETAKKMIDFAAEYGADAVKFQTFKSEKGITKYAPKADYQRKNTSSNETQLEMVKKLELSESDHEILCDYCKLRKIQFLSTPFDLESIEFLNNLGVETFKIPSGELTNLPYLRKIGQLQKNIILSTGMAFLGEIEDALRILLESDLTLDRITLLHCNSEYPTPLHDVNLRAMQTIGHAFPGIKIGYSDHTVGIEVAIAAVVLGATIIEKHFTLDRTMRGPDHSASIEPLELKTMIKAIRNVEKSLGNGIKQPSASENKNKSIARKSLVASVKIRKDEVFTSKNLTAKRPETGISPMRWDDIIGRKAIRDFDEDEFIEI